ncbi:hypothetical protein C162_03152 [Paenibacillus sp. FSL R7-269]|uniref:hypothetical protein n=1 Tax=Paenibacillus sp. FSL R7-269 TaxID=1226755 RepID=UPI0003E219DA|nr:hypothetical protein [Paenibacillus sp. FSL R7-269]ETT55420.1 hypothetical protein C162_03152 [Paenibacillus sp. FSL R7-269]
MSKLDGNERWKTKMLLTDHVQEYEEKQEIEVPRRITVEERTMVRDFILLPYLDTMVNKSLREIELSGSILQRASIIAGQAIQQRIMNDTHRLQKELKQRNIRVVLDEQEEFLVYYKIFYRGYQERFGLTRDVMRTEISLRLTKYTAELAESLQDKIKPRI